MDPEASSSGQRRTEPAPDRGAGSGLDDDKTLPDIGKLSMAEEKKDDMDVDVQEKFLWDGQAQSSGY